MMMSQGPSAANAEKWAAWHPHSKCHLCLFSCSLREAFSPMSITWPRLLA